MYLLQDKWLYKKRDIPLFCVCIHIDQCFYAHFVIFLCKAAEEKSEPKQVCAIALKDGCYLWETATNVAPIKMSGGGFKMGSL